MLLTKSKVFITAVRCGLTFLAGSCSMHAQVGGESYRNLVQAWLNDAKPLVANLARANGDMTSAYSKLERKLPGDVRKTPTWMTLQQNQAKFEAGIKTLTQVLQKGIATDEQYLRQLNRSGGIEEDSASDNLRARVEFQQSLAQASGQFVELLKQIGDGLRSLPESAIKLSELNQMTQARDAMGAVLESSAKQFATRAGEYAGINRNLMAAATSAYTIPFGAAGSLMLEYTISTRTEYGVFKNKVSGKITNTTALPVHCMRVEPQTSGGTASTLLGLTALRIAAGASQPFSQEDIASTTNLRASGISAWKASCTTPISYNFIEASAVRSFPGGTVTGSIGRTQIGITVENNSGEPIEIAWNDSSFIDMTRSAKRIFHTGVKYADREQSLPNTVIPPLAKVEDAAVPAGNVYFVEGQYGGWRENPLLPDEIPPDLADEAMTSLKGVKVALFLQLLISGKKTPVTLTFEVSDVKPGRLN